jgi:hypothetical protein
VCGENEDNHTVSNTHVDIEEDTIDYDTRCECGATGDVTIDGQGTTPGENISHDDASWNEESEEDSDDE